MGCSSLWAMAGWAALHPSLVWPTGVSSPSLRLWVEVGHRGGGCPHQEVGEEAQRRACTGAGLTGGLCMCGGSGPGPLLAGGTSDCGAPPPTAHRPTASLVSTSLHGVPWRNPRGPSGGGACLGVMEGGMALALGPLQGRPAWAFLPGAQGPQVSCSTAAGLSGTETGRLPDTSLRGLAATRRRTFLVRAPPDSGAGLGQGPGSSGPRTGTGRTGAGPGLLGHPCAPVRAVGAAESRARPPVQGCLSTPSPLGTEYLVVSLFWSHGIRERSGQKTEPPHTQTRGF